MPLPRVKLKAIMVLKQVHSADIARALDVTDQSVSNVVRGYSRSERIETEIARKLGMKRKEIFPVIPQHPNLAA